MKTYKNGMKATELSKKQIGVIYGNAKSGNLKVEKWFISSLYDLAEYYGYDDNRSVEQNESDARRIIDAIFAGDIEKAQKRINIMTENWFANLSRKNQQKAVREYI